MHLDIEDAIKVQWNAWSRVCRVESSDVERETAMEDTMHANACYLLARAWQNVDIRSAVETVVLYCEGGMGRAEV